MRISIYSSIANVIRRFSEVGVDMSRVDGLPAYLWHQPMVQTPGDASQRRHLGLLTVAGNAGINLGNLAEMLSLGKRSESVNERTKAMTGTCQLCPIAGGSGHTS